MDTTRLRVGPPCTRDQRPAASLDTVRHEQRSSEKRGHIYRTGSSTKGTHEAHRFPCCFSEILSPAEQAATYKGRPLHVAPAQIPTCGLPASNVVRHILCVNWARPDLCGGRPVMAVPTANVDRKQASPDCQF